jgi:hypothetical protein
MKKELGILFTLAFLFYAIPTFTQFYHLPTAGLYIIMLLLSQAAIVRIVYLVLIRVIDKYLS